MVRFGGRGTEEVFAGLMGCRIAKLPFRYLGVPLGSRYKESGIWDPVIELFERRQPAENGIYYPKGG